MAQSQCRWESPEQWSQWGEWLSAGLHGRNRWRLSVLLLGMLFAGGRRTVTTWLRAAGVSDDYQDYYYFLAAVGCNAKFAAERLCHAASASGNARVWTTGYDRTILIHGLVVYVHSGGARSDAAEMGHSYTSPCWAKAAWPGGGNAAGMSSGLLTRRLLGVIFWVIKIFISDD